MRHDRTHGGRGEIINFPVIIFGDGLPRIPYTSSFPVVLRYLVFTVGSRIRPLRSSGVLTSLHFRDPFQRIARSKVTSYLWDVEMRDGPQNTATRIKHPRSTDNSEAFLPGKEMILVSASVPEAIPFKLFNASHERVHERPP